MLLGLVREIKMPDPIATITQAMLNRTPRRMDDRAFDDKVNGPQGYPRFNEFTKFNDPGWDAFMASGPLSTNIEDRRGEAENTESVDDFIKRTLEAKAR